VSAVDLEVPPLAGEALAAVVAGPAVCVFLAGGVALRLSGEAARERGALGGLGAFVATGAAKGGTYVAVARRLGATTHGILLPALTPAASDGKESGNYTPSAASRKAAINHLFSATVAADPCSQLSMEVIAANWNDGINLKSSFCD
jgi:hypothetical protein